MNEDAKDSGVGVILSSPPPPITKAFRINAKQFFITYPQCPIPKEGVYDLFDKSFNPEELIVAEEKHEDGNKHLHVYVKFEKKLNIKDPRHFDIDGYHPNIQSVHNKNAVTKYVKKDGNYREKQVSTVERLRGLDVFNAQRKAADIIYHEQLIYRVNLPAPPLRFELPNGIIVDRAIREKKRHIWMYGPPDTGKTSWINETFGGTAIFMVNAGKYPFENYMNEEIIIYDDIVPVREDLINATNTWKVLKSIGQVRYKEQYWKIGQERLVIVISNMIPFNDLAINARFNYYEIAAAAQHLILEN